MDSVSSVSRVAGSSRLEEKGGDSLEQLDTFAQSADLSTKAVWGHIESSIASCDRDLSFCDLEDLAPEITQGFVQRSRDVAAFVNGEAPQLEKILVAHKKKEIVAWAFIRPISVREPIDSTPTFTVGVEVGPPELERFDALTDELYAYACAAIVKQGFVCYQTVPLRDPEESFGEREKTRGQFDVSLRLESCGYGEYFFRKKTQGSAEITYLPISKYRYAVASSALENVERIEHLIKYLEKYPLHQEELKKDSFVTQVDLLERLHKKHFSRSIDNRYLAKLDIVRKMLQ